MSKGTISTLSPAEAAKHLGMNISTIRRWINTGKLQTTKSPEGWHRIDKEHLLATAAAQDNSLQVITPTLNSGLEATIKHLSEALDRERMRADRMEQKNEQLQSDMVKMMKEMQAILNKESGLFAFLRTKKS
ncbi:MAG: helix-turn-helix domain-containing protein [Silvanigrellaceae bacterium]|nr:helix-turn-helix domain-containing protein [Silvanigrellaceae bacterium]